MIQAIAPPPRRNVRPRCTPPPVIIRESAPPQPATNRQEEKQSSGMHLVVKVLLVALALSVAGYLALLATSDDTPDKKTSSEAVRKPLANKQGADIPSFLLNNDDEADVDELQTVVDINLPVSSANYVETSPPTPINVLPTPTITLLTIASEPKKEEGEEAQPIENEPVNTIQPFGDLTWEDDLLTVIEKVQKLKGLESNWLELRGGPPINILDNPTMLRQRIRTPVLTSVLGIDKRVRVSQVTIKASPIIISNGVFRLDITFLSEPGHVLKAPNKALAQAKQLFGDNADFYYPLQLDTVRLEMYDIKDPLKEASEQIANHIFDRIDRTYPATLRQPNQASTIGIWKDNAGCQLYLSKFSQRVRLHYSYPKCDCQQQLTALQEQLKEKLKEEEHQKKYAGKEDFQVKL
jgi:hypothetical protein